MSATSVVELLTRFALNISRLIFLKCLGIVQSGPYAGRIGADMVKRFWQELLAKKAVATKRLEWSHTMERLTKQR